MRRYHIVELGVCHKQYKNLIPYAYGTPHLCTVCGTSTLQPLGHVDARRTSKMFPAWLMMLMARRRLDGDGGCWPLLPCDLIYTIVQWVYLDQKHGPMIKANSSEPVVWLSNPPRYIHAQCVVVAGGTVDDAWMRVKRISSVLSHLDPLEFHRLRYVRAKERAADRIRMASWLATAGLKRESPYDLGYLLGAFRYGGMLATTTPDRVDYNITEMDVSDDELERAHALLVDALVVSVILVIASHEPLSMMPMCTIGLHAPHAETFDYLALRCYTYHGSYCIDEWKGPPPEIKKSSKKKRRVRVH